MKFALIAPAYYAQYFAEENLGYHFVLAQYLNDPEYFDMYDYFKRRGHFLMMDNGAAEFGHAIGLEDLMAAAKKLEPDEVILPDVLRDRVTTLTLTREAIPMFPVWQRAVVPQGKNWAEWELCARTMVGWGVSTICVPKLLEDYPGGRLKALQIIEENHWNWDHHVHMLGLWSKPLLEIALAAKHYPWVRGIDSGAPLAYAQAYKSIDHSVRASLQWKEVDVDHGLFLENLYKCLDACRGAL
jgi:hypothetical protein